MIAAVGRAEALAAVALVAGSRQEPVATLRRLAGEDPSLRRLAKVADRCAAGEALPEALWRERLLRKKEAAALAGMTPEIIADELTRIAQSYATPSLGEILARWLPVWAVLAATLPSLAIGAVVALISHGLYGGVWWELGYGSWDVESAVWWLAQLAGVAVAALIVWLDWWLLRSLPVIRRLTVFSRNLERSELAARLVRLLRAGHDGTAAIERWAARCGDRTGVRRVVGEAGGDPATALMELGVVPRDGDGRPGWDEALAEIESERAAAAAALSPWLSAVLLMVGVAGLLSWSTSGLTSFERALFGGGSALSVPLLDQLMDQSRFAREALPVAVFALEAAAASLAVAYVIAIGGWLTGFLAGPAQEWPRVADRLARALDQRRDLAAALRGLRLSVRRAMRRRIDAALANGEPHPGRRIAAAGIAPRLQASALAATDAADAAALLHAAADRREHPELRALLRQTAVVSALTLLVLALLGGGMDTLARLHRIFDSLHIDGGLAFALLAAARLAAAAVLAAAVVIAFVAAIGRRRGWWIALGGWARRARGLVLRRLLAGGAREAELAQALRATLPCAPRALEEAGGRGDLSAVLSIAGWPVRTLTELDRALAADLRTRDRLSLRLAAAVRLLLPFVLATPIGLMAAAVMLTVTLVQGTAIAQCAGERQSMPTGTPSLMLLYWATARCEAQGDAVVEDYQERRLHPPIPVLPRTKVSEKQNKKP